MRFVPKAPFNNIPALVQTMAWCQPGDKPLSEPMLVDLLTHICVTQPQCSVHENHRTCRTFPMAKPKCLMRDFSNLNRICLMNHASFSFTLLNVLTFFRIIITLRPRQKQPVVCRQHFQMHFLLKKLGFNSNFTLKLLSDGPVNIFKSQYWFI